MAFGWKLYGDGKTLPLGEAVAPDERLSWPRTVGIGAQHVVAMFGATFVFPLLMGLDPNLAIMMSGVATILFLLIVQGKVPSYLGSSASFVGGVVAVRAAGGSDADVLGALLVSGVVLALAGLVIHLVGVRVVNRVLPPAVTGAVVMLIGFNLAPVATATYWQQDQWVALATMAFVVVASLLLRGFLARISILLGLVFGYLLSILLDRVSGPLTSTLPGQNLRDAAGDACAPEGPYCVATAFPHDRVGFDAVGRRALVRPAGLHRPLVLGELLAARAARGDRPRRGERRPREGGGRDDPARPRPDDRPGGAGRRRHDRAGTSVGGSPTTTYAENIGVMAATRVYSTAAYYVAAVVAIGLGLVPKFGALINAIPGGVLGGITVVLYGMIGLLGAKIWKENRVDFGNPINLVPLAAGIVIAVGNSGNDAPLLQITDDFSLGGIALGTIVTVVGWHVARALAPAEMRASLTREGPHPAAGSTFGHVHGAEDGPSSAGEVGRGTA